MYVRTYASPTHCPSPSPVSQYTTIVSTVSLLKGSPREVQFDLASRADYLDPDKLERTIYVKPLAVNCTKEMLKVCVCVCVCVCAHVSVWVHAWVHVYLCELVCSVCMHAHVVETEQWLVGTGECVRVQPTT